MNDSIIFDNFGTVHPCFWKHKRLMTCAKSTPLQAYQCGNHFADYMECVNQEKYLQVEKLKQQARRDNKGGKILSYPVYNKEKDRFEDIRGKPLGRKLS